MSYVFDNDDRFPVAPVPVTKALVPQQQLGALPSPIVQYGQQGLVPYGQLGANEDSVKLIKDILILAGIFALFYWLVSEKSPLKNPDSSGGISGNPGRPGRLQTRNTLARVGQNSDGSYYWKLLRRRGKRHGPYASADDAVADAESKGYRILS